MGEDLPSLFIFLKKNPLIFSIHRFKFQKADKHVAWQGNTKFSYGMGHLLNPSPKKNIARGIGLTPLLEKGGRV